MIGRTFSLAIVRSESGPSIKIRTVDYIVSVVEKFGEVNWLVYMLRNG